MDYNSSCEGGVVDPIGKVADFAFANTRALIDQRANGSDPVDVQEPFAGTTGDFGVALDDE